MKFKVVCLSLITLLASSAIVAQVLTRWVEVRTPFTSNIIALGYPVPIPVNTPLPFDGFRTYAGLHMRHQDLAASTSYVHPVQIGTTFAGRTIWAYRLGDEDRLTIDGLPEPATLTNGGTHPREWQTPEVLTGILELLALHENDHHFYDYLRDNVNMIVIPILNIDSFLQTQRTPALNYLQSDPDFPNDWPRDGRMRRKNMRNTDEDLLTTADHLNGVDLNRNNEPFWATDPNQSSAAVDSLIHHGTSPQSEPETRALDVAAALGPVQQLRLYTDVHSFSMVHFWVRDDNDRLALQTEEVLRTFTDHQRAFPAGKWYAFAGRDAVARNQGIGTTDEYFTHIYQVPSWTLEVEPSGGQSFHAPLPGSGADYGGVSENGHDGFILPDSQIRRVREELAQSFAAVYYRQAGPPAIQSLRIIDSLTGAVVYETAWDPVDNLSRALYANQLQPLELNHSYAFWLSFNKPMRWRAAGKIVAFPGQPDSGLEISSSILINNAPLSTNTESSQWLDQPGGAPDGYRYYRDDALKMTLRFPDDTQNRNLVAGGAVGTLKIRVADITGMRTDTNPGTVADWQDGAWIRYENTSGNESDFGGWDTTLSFAMTDQPVPPPFLLEPGMTSSWFDPTHNGEGFLLEMLTNNVVVLYWFTYDDQGNQDWYVAVGEVRGNRIEFAELQRVSGGEFGPGFDPQKVTRTVVGSASFIFSGCNAGSMSYRIGTRHGRLQLARLTILSRLGCGGLIESPVVPEGVLSGSWFDLSHDGEGFNLQVLIDGRVVVYWFSFDPQGNRRWFFGVGEIRDGKLVFDNLLTSTGGIFGPDFNPLDVTFPSWGTLVLELNCQGGTATYSSTEPGFGSGVLNVIRLTNIDGLACP